MLNRRVIEVLKAERECVKRNVSGCDRECSKCDLVLPDKEIIEAYDEAIELLEDDDRK